MSSKPAHCSEIPTGHFLWFDWKKPGRLSSYDHKKETSVLTLSVSALLTLPELSLVHRSACVACHTVFLMDQLTGCYLLHLIIWSCGWNIKQKLMQQHKMSFVKALNWSLVFWRSGYSNSTGLAWLVVVGPVTNVFMGPRSLAVTGALHISHQISTTSSFSPSSLTSLHPFSDDNLSQFKVCVFFRSIWWNI